MKKTIYLIGLLLAVLLSTTGRQVQAAPRQITGSGRIVTAERPTVAFRQVQASRSVKVNLVPAGDKIRIEADDNLIDYVEIRAEGGQLTVTLSSDLKTVRNPHVTVSIPADEQISGLSASSSASIISEMTLSSDKVKLRVSSCGSVIAAVKARSCDAVASSSGTLHLGINAVETDFHASSCGKITAVVNASTVDTEASSSGTIKLTATASAIDATASSSGTIKLSGTATEIETSCSSSGRIDAEKLTAERGEATASSSGHITVCTTEHLKARASSSGHIAYTGRGSITRTTSSGGSVRKL